MKHKYLLLSIGLLLLLLPAFSNNAQAKESCFKFQLKPGPYAVGFKTVNQYDHSRTFYPGYDLDGNPVKEHARPIQTSIWYPADPAKAKGKPRMKLKDYICLMAWELDFPPMTEKKKKETMDLLRDGWGVNEDRFNEFEVQCKAVRGAEAAKGSFPLIVYGPSMNSMSVENEAICEHLASHGYIIVSSPSLGTNRRYLAPLRENAEEQARDMEFLLSYMQTFPNVDKDKVAVMGFSWGAMSNVLMAMRDSRVDAVVSLDGSLKNPRHPLQATPDEEPAKPGAKPKPAVVKVPAHPDYNPDKLTMPMFFASSKEIPDALYKKAGIPPPKDRSFRFYENLKYSDRYLFQFHHMTHHNFSSGFIRLLDGDPNLTSPMDKINKSHNMMCKYVHMFLDAYLKGDAAALEFMKRTPKENGYTAEYVSKKFKKGKKAPLGYNAFIHHLKKNGAASIEKLHGEQVKLDPKYKMNGDILSFYAWKLSIDKNYKEAKIIFDFMLKGDPYNWDALNGVATVYEKTGKLKEALAIYEKAYKMRPYYVNLLKKIDKIKKQMQKKR